MTSSRLLVLLLSLSEICKAVISPPLGEKSASDEMSMLIGEFLKLDFVISLLEARSGVEMGALPVAKKARFDSCSASALFYGCSFSVFSASFLCVDAGIGEPLF